VSDAGTMCRWLVYCGDIILLSDLLITSNHSLLKQALPNRSLYTPQTEKSDFFDPVKHTIRNHITNGDGFGISWYTHSHNKSFAHCYKSILPAWNDKNLTSICEGIRSDLVFAHVRASSGSNISRENCHPFKWGSFSFMHNGAIANFNLVKRKLHASLSDEVFSILEGTTDSETAFAMFLNEINPTLKHMNFTPQEIATALQKTIQDIVSITGTINSNASSLNFAITDGYSVVCTRFRNCPNEDPPSLYCAHGSEFSVDSSNNNEFVMKSEGVKDTVIISSEPLSTEGDWKLIPRNHMVITFPTEENINEQNIKSNDQFIKTRIKSFYGSRPVTDLIEKKASDLVEKKAGDNYPLLVRYEEIICKF